MNIPCFLIPILVGLISALLGYFLGKMMSGGNDLNLKSKLDATLNENEKLNNKLYLLERDINSDKDKSSSTLQADLDACKVHSAKLQAEIDSLKAKSSSATHGFAIVTETSYPFDADLAFSVFGKKINQDDLKIVDGIGPKIEELYHNAGIKTWKALSETHLEQSQEILNEAGSGYAMHNPESWAKQALLAYHGKWNELKDYQESLDGGRE